MSQASIRTMLFYAALCRHFHSLEVLTGRTFFAQALALATSRSDWELFVREKWLFFALALFAILLVASVVQASGSWQSSMEYCNREQYSMLADF